MTHPRARDLGLPFPGEPGPWNAITDVPGLRVGFCTLTDPARRMRTGVTAILPRADKGQPRPVAAGIHVLNGNGEMTGTHWIEDAGHFIGPICLTNTHGVGAVHHGAVRWMIDQYDSYFREEHAWAMPVVAETYDGMLNDINALHVTPDHALEAIRSARTGPVPEGSVGGGNGMIAYEFKAGTGTASRKLRFGDRDHVIGVLVQANHGTRPWLRVLGRPLGEILGQDRIRRNDQGSVIVIVATDAPLSSLSLRHLARRAGMGIARGGTPGGNSSGDIFLALSVADIGPMPQMDGLFRDRSELNGEWIDPLYLATAEAVEEAVINAIVAGEDCVAVKPEGLKVPGINRQALADLFAMK